ncbi:MAG: ATP-binding cassette domain-containing protein [Bacilli bacterium]|nr:ATP-binding cassette domain-containing protein [Bacilli bacterium]
MPSIEFSEVTAFYNNIKAKTTTLVLEDFSFAFKDALCTAIIGKSGCGKTTLLKCIANLVEYDGTIYIDGVDADTTRTKEKNIAYVAQEIDLLSKKTVFDNLYFPLEIKKVNPFEAREKIYEMSEEFGVSFLLARKVKELSLGQQRLVSFMRAMLKEPSIILLDEPTSSLDKDTSQAVLSTLKKYMANKKTTCIMVTHKIEEATAFGDELCVMDDGKILVHGAPFDVVKSPLKKVQDLLGKIEEDAA